VVPMALRGLWGSFFSRKDGPAMRRPFRRFWSRIELVVGEPIPPERVKASDLAVRVARLADLPPPREAPAHRDARIGAVDPSSANDQTSSVSADPSS
jgi:hypothetical protein